MDIAALLSSGKVVRILVHESLALTLIQSDKRCKLLSQKCICCDMAWRDIASVVFLECSMPLKLSLKPYEKILVNGAVIENGGNRAEILIHNKASILRQNDILKEENADTPAKRLFYIIQLIYISTEHRTDRLRLLSDSLLDYLLASPSSQELVNTISMSIIEGRYYAALQACKKLIQHEARILKHESHDDRESIRQSPKDGGIPQTNRSAGPA